MKCLSAGLTFTALLLTSPLSAETALKDANTNLKYPLSESVIKEVTPLIEGNENLQKKVEGPQDVFGVHDLPIWEAARKCSFNQAEFSRKFPHLFAYARVILVSSQYFDAPRVIYRLPRGFLSLELRDTRMVYGNSELPAAVEFPIIKKWTGPGKIDDWDGTYSVEKTAKGLYLCRTSIGHETGSGHSNVEHILAWVKVEANRLVPVRCEGYSVPHGEKRQAKHLHITTYPAE